MAGTPFNQIVGLRLRILCNQDDRQFKLLRQVLGEAQLNARETEDVHSWVSYPLDDWLEFMKLNAVEFLFVARILKAKKLVEYSCDGSSGKHMFRPTLKAIKFAAFEKRTLRDILYFLPITMTETPILLGTENVFEQVDSETGAEQEAETTLKM